MSRLLPLLPACLLGLLLIQPAAAQRGLRPGAGRMGGGEPGLPGPLLPDLSLIDGGAARPAAINALPAPWGQMAGQTTYDLQSNLSTAHRVLAEGARIATVWTQVCPAASTPPFSYRGVGYNRAAAAGGPLADSATHCTAYGIANERTGWPELVRVNGQDIVFAHTSNGISRITRPTDTTPWVSALLPFTQQIGGRAACSAYWPRAVASGTTIHMVYIAREQPNSGFQPGNPLVYSRSPDGGLTWDRQNIQLSDFDTLHVGEIGGDRYALAVNGNTVAIVAGSVGYPTRVAVSSDGGNTFATQRVTPAYTAADTLMVPTSPPTPCVMASDGAMALAVDATGTVHWFSGTTLAVVAYDTLAGAYVGIGSAFSDSGNQLLYWNNRELVASPPQVVANYPALGLAAPTSSSGSGSYSLNGLISAPTATVDPGGDVYCVFTTRMPTAPLGAFYRYSDLYLQKLTFPNGTQVQAHIPRNISSELRGVPGGAAALRFESACPSACPTIENGLLHYQWLSDTIAGFNTQPGNPIPSVNISAVMLDTIEVGRVVFQPWRLLATSPTGLSSTTAHFNAGLAPNPTSGLTTLRLDLRAPLRVGFTVRDVLGRAVLTQAPRSLAAGAQVLLVDLSAQPAGVYSVTVEADGQRITQRLLKQ